jgi:hypothetical protein
LHVLRMAPGGLLMSDALELCLVFFVRLDGQQTLERMPLLFEQDASLVLPFRAEGVTQGPHLSVQTLKPLPGPFFEMLALELQWNRVQALHPYLQLLEPHGDLSLGDRLGQSMALVQAIAVQFVQQDRPLGGAHFGMVLTPSGQGALQRDIQIAQLSCELPQGLKCCLAVLRRLRQQGFVKLQKTFVPTPGHPCLVQSFRFPVLGPSLEQGLGVLQRDPQEMHQMPPDQVAVVGRPMGSRWVPGLGGLRHGSAHFEMGQVQLGAGHDQ